MYFSVNTSYKKSMSIVLSVYTENAFKEIVLPSLNNSDYSITLQKNYFSLKEDVVLQLEVMHDLWNIRSSNQYQLRSAVAVFSTIPLTDKKSIRLRTINNESVSIFVKEKEAGFHAYTKFSLKRISSVSIGRDQKDDIVYDFMKMVSDVHAKIEKTSCGHKIISCEKNGVYVNTTLIQDERTLVFGDYIDILGLHMVYLGDLIAIDCEDDFVKINEATLKKAELDDNRVFWRKDDLESTQGKIVYHRPPRTYEKINEEIIEIEEPPQAVKTKRPPLYMIIGPSFTMVIPMLLGCILMVSASKASGAGTSIFMFSGLLMSVASAIIGVCWSLANIRHQEKMEKETEEYRERTYSNYLFDKQKEIEKIYRQTERKMLDNYPAAAVCLDYSDTKGMLWNRNRTHGDFLVHRLGLGKTLFQVHIDIPKEKFELYRDELANKPAEIEEKYKMLESVPITLDLIEQNLLGIVGGKGKQGAIDIAKLLSIQIAANNCYTDVKMAYIYSGEASTDIGEWDFAKWFPHVWSEDKKNRFVASTKEEASDVFYQLTKVCRQRLDEKDDEKKQTVPKPYYVVFISDMKMLEGELFTKYIFSRDVKLGLTVILLAEHYEQLPNECEFIIENTSTFAGMYNVFADQKDRVKVAFDKVEDEKLERFSRKLSSIQILELEEGGEIPSSLTFFDMLKIQRPDDLNVSELWTKCRTYENIKGMLGEKAGGVPCYLDVHEKYHGPHGLVAGTTGSGKSETLQTYILSLAINYSPDDVGFFIIDYKGGGMANLFKGLPHLIGQISNLSGNQVRRAMVSIKSENLRRQRIFNEYNVNNINAYTKLYKDGEAQIPVPHLFIIIDEFAELKREEPEFMKELISVAQVGRSLGVHLILATQKPSGTVDDNIWSNSKFRLCLRVQDQQDSKDMLHKPDAAFLTRAGRCYLQVGNDEVYELFQSGYSGARYDENMATGNDVIAKIVGLTGKTEMAGTMSKNMKKTEAEEAWVAMLTYCFDRILSYMQIEIYDEARINQRIDEILKSFYMELSKKSIDYPESIYNTERLLEFIQTYIEMSKWKKHFSAKMLIEFAKERKRKFPQPKEKTQLDAIVEYLANQALENGYTYRHQLWMPVLEDCIYLEEFEKATFNGHVWEENPREKGLSVCLGKFDDPENQNQMPLKVDLIEDGNVSIFGNITSGKSTMLQTFMYALISRYSPDRVNIYGIDFSSKMMASFKDAPHIGGVMFENELDKITKFFNMMSSILKERKELIKGGSYKQFIQTSGQALPAIVIFIDNYGAFKEKTSEKFENNLLQLSKEGIHCGIYFVITGTGIGMSAVTSKIADNMQKTLCLELQDKYAYGDLLHNMQIRVLPEVGKKGRGLAYFGDRILEYQTVLPFEAENDYERMDRISEICMNMKSIWRGSTARRIPEIPEKPVWSEFAKMDEYVEAIKSSDKLPVGYNAMDASVYSIPLRDNYCYLVTGKQQAGQTNFIRVAMQAAIDKKANVCIIDGPAKELEVYDKFENVTYITEEEKLVKYFVELSTVFKERNVKRNEMRALDYEKNEIFEEMKKTDPYFIFISELGWFVEFIEKSQENLNGFFNTIFTKGTLHNIYFFAEFDLNRRIEMSGKSVYGAFVNHRTGIHFGGKAGENSVLAFDYLSYAEQNKVEKANIGLLSKEDDSESATRIVIPLARK